jgi:hypothetical protein
MSKHRDKKKEDVEDDDEDPVSPVSTAHLVVGDRAIVLYRERLLEVRLQQVLPNHLKFLVYQSLIGRLGYPWAVDSSPIRREQKTDFKHEKDQLYLYLPKSQSPKEVLAFITYREQGNKKYWSTWSEFRDHILEFGDRVLVFEQATTFRTTTRDDPAPPIAFQKAIVTRVHEDGIIRIDYEDTDEHDILPQGSLRVWKRISQLKPPKLPVDLMPAKDAGHKLSHA